MCLRFDVDVGQGKATTAFRLDYCATQSSQDESRVPRAERGAVDIASDGDQQKRITVALVAFNPVVALASPASDRARPTALK